MKFCDVEKVGIFCDTYTPATERRRDAEVRVVKLSLRIQPLTLAIAAAIDPLLRRLLFKSTGEPQPYLRELALGLDVPRQLLRCYASRDTETASLALDQVKIGKVRARLRKDVEGWALFVKASLGPCSRDELAYVQDWFGGQRFVTFTAAQADLFEAPTPAADADEPVDGGAVVPDPAKPPTHRPRARTH